VLLDRPETDRAVRPAPEKRAATACSPWSSASECKNASMSELDGPSYATTWKMPLSMVKRVPGAMT
jgi:positive regulator of sigma E activity